MTTVMMPLLDEGTDVWRPVQVTALQGAVYRIEGSMPPDEAWRYAPGELVELKWQRLADGGDYLVPAGAALSSVRSILSHHFKRSAGISLGALSLLMAIGLLPRDGQGRPDTLGIAMLGAACAVVALIALVLWKPNSIIMRWLAWSIFGLGLFIALMALLVSMSGTQ